VEEEEELGGIVEEEEELGGAERGLDGIEQELGGGLLAEKPTSSFAPAVTLMVVNEVLEKEEEQQLVGAEQLLQLAGQQQEEVDEQKEAARHSHTLLFSCSLPLLLRRQCALV